MWVRIRGAPYVTMTREGTTQYVATALQSQLGAETHMIALINGVAAIAVIVLASRATKISHPIVSRLTTILCLVLILAAFAAELVVFRRKMGLYPFHLIIK